MVPVSVTVLLFAALRDRLGGESRIEVQLERITFDSSLSLVRYLASTVERLQGIREFESQLAIAINEEYKTEEDGSILLNPGDRIALIPPITGG